MAYEPTDVTRFTAPLDRGNGKILIIGAGNTVMSDEGFGPRCLEELGKFYDFPDCVELMDAGTMGMSLLPIFEDYKHLIILDAAQETGHPAGTILLFTPEELASMQVMHTAHDVRLIDVLKAAIMVGHAPTNAFIVGVQIASLEPWKMELTPEVEAALPIACAAALDQLARYGIEPTLKKGAERPSAIEEARENYEPQPESEH